MNFIRDRHPLSNVKQHLEQGVFYLMNSSGIVGCLVVINLNIIRLLLRNDSYKYRQLSLTVTSEGKVEVKSRIPWHLHYKKAFDSLKERYPELAEEFSKIEPLIEGIDNLEKLNSDELVKLINTVLPEPFKTKLYHEQVADLDLRTLNLIKDILEVNGLTSSSNQIYY